MNPMSVPESTLFVAPQESASQVMLCADSTSLAYPEMIGLMGVGLEGCRWLTLNSEGSVARESLRREAARYREVWVVSADDIDGINLAAALAFDHPTLPIFLICERPNGSLMSRAQSAGIKGTLTLSQFVRRFETVAAELEETRPAVTSGRRTPTPGAVDPDPFESETSSVDPAHDEALRLSIERLRSIALTPNPPAQASEVPFDTDFGVGNQGEPTTFAGPDHTTIVPTVAEEVETVAVPKRSRPTLDGEAPPACNQTAMRPASDSQRRKPAVQNGFLISVLSGSGGAGKSTVSALVAARIARQGLNVALLDCDLQFGDMAAFFGKRDAVTIDQVLQEGDGILRNTPRDGTPFIIAAPGHVEQSETVDIERLIELVLPQFDVVVANTGAGWGDVHAYLMETSTRVLFVVDQRISSVRACLHGLDLCRRCGIASNSFLYVLNRCAKGAPFTSIDLSCALKGASVAELREGGLEVEELLGSGLAMELAETPNPCVDSIADMLGPLLPERLAALAESRRAEQESTRGARRRKSSHFRRKRTGHLSEVAMTP